MKQDLKKAKMALDRAAERGDELACKILSRWHEKGIGGGGQDIGRAAWYRGGI